jgi:hypothetical protein
MSRFTTAARAPKNSMENGGGSAYEPFARDGPIGTATRPAPDGSPVSTAGLAQLVEHVICNHGVGGSNPSAGTTLKSFAKSVVLPWGF